jgi:hypothetical protein
MRKSCWCGQRKRAEGDDLWYAIKNCRKNLRREVTQFPNYKSDINWSLPILLVVIKECELHSAHLKLDKGTPQ